MKNKNNIRLLIAIAAIVFAAATTTSCKKNETIVPPSNEVILQQKIDEIIPQKYLDTLRNLGLTIHKETNPINIEGIYTISPTQLRATNRFGDVIGSIGFVSKIKLFAQSSTNFGISLLGKDFINTNDTSIATAISGSGNDFTIYGKMKSVSGTKSAIFAIVLSGTKDGTTLRNVEFGLINIDNSNGAGVFIEEGEARIWFDNDFESESASVFRFINPINSPPLTIPNNPKHNTPIMKGGIL